MGTKILRRVNYFELFLTITIFLFGTTTNAQSGWNSNDWGYRRAITVSNSTGNLLTNFQIKVTLNNSFDFSRCKTDGSDIRFTSDDSQTLIPYWIEEWNPTGTSATIWVKVPSVPTSGTQIFMYYQNLSATSIQNGKNVFEFFDDFENWPTNTSSWVDKGLLITPKADLSCAVYDGKLYAIGGYNNTGSDSRAETYEYNPGTNTWIRKADLPTPRWGPIAVEFNGKIHVFAGMLNGVGVANHEIYDPVLDTWESRTLGNPLNIPKYGASGVVHPDVLYFPSGKDGYKYWMSYTPYPPQSKENASIIRSNDGITWTDAGIINPVIPAGTSGSWNDLENPDPDMIYVANLDKWFMVWDGGDAATNSRKIALAYSADGKTWTQYNGNAVNGNTNPVILSGDDIHGQPWEISGSYSKTCTPTLFYESGTFYLFYAEEASGNNRGKVGLATFAWDNTTNSIINLDRNSSNPIIDLPEDINFKSGGGHLDISKNPNTNEYHLYIVRELLSSASYELALLTSTDKINWTNQGKVLERGLASEWDATHIYRSAPVVNSQGEIVFFDNKIRLFYSAFGNPGIGIADIPSSGSPIKFTGSGPQNVPAGLADQGLMGVKLGDKIHLFYKQNHYEYDPATDTYTQKANVPTPRTWGTCAVYNNKIYILGGYSYGSPSGATNVNEVYDPGTNSWTTMAPMPISKYGVTRENPVINGKIYVTHGLNGGFHIDNYAYDPESNTWSQKSSATHMRDGVGCGVINNKLYVVGGRADQVGPYGVLFNEEYDPLTDAASPLQWTLSNPAKVKTDPSAKYEGNNGLMVENDVNVEQYALHTQAFGKVAVDVFWNITTAYGISDANLQPQGRIVLSAAPADGSLYFYQQSGAPRFRWYNGSLNHLQDGNWNTWNKVTIIRDGVNSKVQINGTTYPVTCAATNTDRVFLGIFWPTREFFDLVRVRKYADPAPTSVIDAEQSLDLTITATSGSDGSISPQGNVIVNYGENQTFTVSPNAGYHIADVLVDGSSVGALTSHTFTNVTANHTIAASFAINTYTLTITSANGTVTKNPDQVNYNHGSTVQLTATPAVGYSFSSWSGDASGSTNPLTVTMDGNKNITANFTLNTYTVTITSLNGAVTKNPDQASYNYGTDVTLTATADIGYHFLGWSGDASGNTNPLLVTMNGNKNINANFLPLNVIAFDDFNRADESPFTVGGNWVKAFGSGYVNLSNNQVAGISGEALYYWQGGGSFDNTRQFARARVVNANGQVGLMLLGGTNQALNVAWNTGTLYIYWYLNGSHQGELAHVSSTIHDGDIIEAVLDGGIIYAKINGTIVHSVANTTSLTSGNPGFEFYQGGAIFDDWEAGTPPLSSYTITASAGAGGTITPTGSVNVNSGSSQTFTIAPDADYHIADVLVDGISVGAVSSYTFNNVIADHSISANFAINTYTLTITSVNGTVAKNPDLANYSHGTIVQLTATPSAGYTFSGWSGDATGSTNPLTVTMDGNKNITANFAVDNSTYIIIASASANAGARITIPVSVHFGSDANIPQYILQGKIIFDPTKLAYRTNSIGALFSSMGWTFTGYSNTAGQFDFTATGYNLILTDGILFNLTFDVISNTNGSTQITSLPSYWLCNNSNTPALFSSITPGTINITSQSTSIAFGDVDENFNVDFSDAVAIIYHVFNVFPLHGQALLNADVDHSGNITLADAVGVILYCTFGDWSYSLSILFPLTNAYLSIDNPVINNKGVVLPLNIKNADNVRSLEVTVEYDPTKFSYESFSAGINSSNTITKASLVSPGQAKFVFASSKLMNDDFTVGSVTLKTKNGTLVNGGSIKTSYKINDGKEVAGTSINTGVTDVAGDYGHGIPSKFELIQNYPNPFNPTTVIDFRIPVNGYYVVKVFNAIGQTVSVLAEKEFSVGNYKVTFDGNNLSSGIYFYQLFGNGVNLIRKMMLIK